MNILRKTIKINLLMLATCFFFACSNTHQKNAKDKKNNSWSWSYFKPNNILDSIKNVFHDFKTNSAQRYNNFFSKKSTERRNLNTTPKSWTTRLQNWVKGFWKGSKTSNSNINSKKKKLSNSRNSDKFKDQNKNNSSSCQKNETTENFRDYILSSDFGVYSDSSDSELEEKDDDKSDHEVYSDDEYFKSLVAESGNFEILTIEDTYGNTIDSNTIKKNYKKIVDLELSHLKKNDFYEFFLSYINYTDRIYLQLPSILLDYVNFQISQSYEKKNPFFIGLNAQNTYASSKVLYEDVKYGILSNSHVRDLHKFYGLLTALLQKIHYNKNKNIVANEDVQQKLKEFIILQEKIKQSISFPFPESSLIRMPEEMANKLYAEIEDGKKYKDSLKKELTKSLQGEVSFTKNATWQETQAYEATLQLIVSVIQNNSVSQLKNMIFHGYAGRGKTTLLNLVKKAFNGEISNISKPKITFKCLKFDDIVKNCTKNKNEKILVSDEKLNKCFDADFYLIDDCHGKTDKVVWSKIMQILHSRGKKYLMTTNVDNNVTFDYLSGKSIQSDLQKIVNKNSSHKFTSYKFEGLSHRKVAKSININHLSKKIENILKNGTHDQFSDCENIYLINSNSKKVINTINKFKNNKEQYPNFLHNPDFSVIEEIKNDSDKALKTVLYFDGLDHSKAIQFFNNNHGWKLLMEKKILVIVMEPFANYDEDRLHIKMTWTKCNNPNYNSFSKKVQEYEIEKELYESSNLYNFFVNKLCGKSQYGYKQYCTESQRKYRDYNGLDKGIVDRIDKYIIYYEDDKMSQKHKTYYEKESIFDGRLASSSPFSYRKLKKIGK